MTTFFTADSHFGHANILNHMPAARPFANVDDMDAALVKAWNSVVQPEDTICHLGDFSFLNVEKTAAVLNKLNGKKHWITGNHDSKLKDKSEVRHRFESVQPYLEQKFTLLDGTIQRVTMCHFPMLVWNQSHRGSWMLHGHSHGSLKLPWPMRLMDVGADTNELKPYSLLEIEQYMATQSTTIHDHHKERA